MYDLSLDDVELVAGGEGGSSSAGGGNYRGASYGEGGYGGGGVGTEIVCGLAWSRHPLLGIACVIGSQNTSYGSPNRTGSNQSYGGQGRDTGGCTMQSGGAMAHGRC
jgi:hypothetical protein